MLDFNLEFYKEFLCVFKREKLVTDLLVERAADFVSHANHECILERSDWLKVRVAVILKVKLPVTPQNLKSRQN